MEDNSADEEIKEENQNQSPQQGGKKLKLNDGSSQESFKDIVPSSKEEKDENADSGVSADKSESTSSEERVTSGNSWTEPTEGPSNEVVNAAPSSSNVRAILLQIKRPQKANRNYRKRKNTPDIDSDSETSVPDSDDLSDEETAPARNEDRHNTDDDMPSREELQGFLSNLSDDSDGSISNSNNSNGSNNSNDSNDSYDSSELVRMRNLESDSDDAPPEEDEDQTPPSVLLKTKPKHNWFMVQELIKREMGLTFPFGKMAKNDVLFEQKYYGSLHAVHRLELMYKLNKHRGCVNSINFNPEGYLLASGSDDTNVIVWDWATNTALQSIKTGHKSNVFQSKFMYLNSRSQLNIVTCARDGQVRLLQCPPSGGASVSRRKLVTHQKAAHKLHVSPAEPHVVISAGEDGFVFQADVRQQRASEKIVTVKDKGATIALYSVHGHPLQPAELVVAGRDRFVRVYDRRKSNKPLNMYCPTFFHEAATKKKWMMPSLYITCAVYNHDGSEILASYSDDDIYLFDVQNDFHEPSSSKDGFTHRYSGHRNSATFKGVAFFGPRSQFVVSGSDCSNIYIWDKNSEAIVQWMWGDEGGVVNCVESHPRCPVLASSGLDKDIKIWMPSKETDPLYKGLERVVRENATSQLRSPLFNDFLPSLYTAWRGENSRLFSDDDNDVPSSYGNIEFDGNVCTTF